MRTVRYVVLKDQVIRSDPLGVRPAHNNYITATPTLPQIGKSSFRNADRPFIQEHFPYIPLTLYIQEGGRNTGSGRCSYCGRLWNLGSPLHISPDAFPRRFHDRIHRLLTRPRLSAVRVYAVSGRWPVLLDLRWGPTPTGRIPGSNPCARGAFQKSDSRLSTVIIYEVWTSAAPALKMPCIKSLRLGVDLAQRGRADAPEGHANLTVLRGESLVFVTTDRRVALLARPGSLYPTEGAASRTLMHITSMGEGSKMIYDPLDINICMNSKGVLFYRRPEGSDPEWEELGEMNTRGEFRRPEW